MGLQISANVRNKLTSRHGVSEFEIEQCFANRDGNFLEDTREEHRTEPPTKWFIAETDYGRQLKVVFVPTREGHFRIKTAYEPNSTEINIYRKYGALQ